MELFRKTLNSLNLETIKKEESVLDCSHHTITEENGIQLCMDCGLEVGKFVSYEREWRYYGGSDSKHSSDPNRCQNRKSDEKTIFKDVENMSFPENVVNVANNMYMKVTNGKIYRGKSRKSRIFACIFNSYKIAGKSQSCDVLCRVFNLSKKEVLKGLKYVNLNIPKQECIQNKYITPIEIIVEIMDLFYATDEQKKEIIKLYSLIKDKSNVLNRSRPQSVSAGLIYYYIQKNKRGINIKNFADKVKLSELTILKIAKEIKCILEE